MEPRYPTPCQGLRIHFKEQGQPPVVRKGCQVHRTILLAEFACCHSTKVTIAASRRRVVQHRLLAGAGQTRRWFGGGVAISAHPAWFYIYQSTRLEPAKVYREVYGLPR